MQDIRNIAIIAHVDHGKTTLVDRMIYQANLVRRPEDLGNLILDNNDLERERGITILAKNVSVTYKGVKINIIDTPGHSDFGGEVERVLNMADGVLLLVDAFEGCMPQTRFVLNKAIDMGKKPIVVINKVDKPNCRPDEVQEEVFELMFNLGANEDQLDFKTVYGSAKQGWMSSDWRKPTGDITALLDTILEEIPAPAQLEGTPQMLVSSLEYSPYVGRIAVGRITRGSLRAGMPVSLCKRYDIVEKSKIQQLMIFEGLGKANVDEVQCGDICAVVGIDGFEIGDTIADFENPEALPPIAVDEPTMSMLFMINNSPFFGKDGKFVTSRHIKERLDKELEKNLALRVKPGVNADSFVVYGRGVLHLSVLIETMRREGFELQVGQPKVLDKTINGQRCEPIEELSIEVPEQFVGAAIELSTRRKGALIRMEPRGDRTLLEFEIPTRGLMGLRSNLLTATQGEAVVAHRFKDYQPYKGDIEMRTQGSLVSLETGEAIAYSMNKLLDRGRFFVEPGEEIYGGQVVGEHTRDRDLNINICKTKKLTNVRASGSDEKVVLPPAVKFSLEEALEYIQEDELVEITPNHMRMRKIMLDPLDRKRNSGGEDGYRKKSIGFRKIICTFASLNLFQVMDYIIPLNGWAAGEREFRWHAGTEFFQMFDNAEILDADVDVEAKVVKSGHYIGVDLDVEGSVTVPCDRCLEDLTLPVDAHPSFSVKFGEEVSPGGESGEGEREILCLSDSDADLDLRQVIYDFVCLSLPMQKVHDEGQCNPDTVRFLSHEQGNEEAAAMNSPFAALKGLL